MKKRKFYINYLIFMLLFSVPILTFGQEKTITGTVVSAGDNMPLLGATVIIKGTTTGASTDFDGVYSINASTGDVLVFTYIGYKETEITVGNESVINVSLVEDASVLDEVVITGYGKQTRATLTTSISKLDTQILETSTRSNAATALQGTIAGLRVTNNTGQPGSTPSIVLRGGTGFDGSGSPLVLIDGVQGSFYALNADDIESIEVLKDAAATAIYGARSANGVILVTTKTGKVGKSSINYKYKFSMNEERNDQKYLSADFINYNRQGHAYLRETRGDSSFLPAFINGANSFAIGGNTIDSPFTTQLLTPANQYLLSQPGWKSIPDILDPSREILFFDNQGVSDRIYQNSETQDHYLSFDGGNEKGTYYLGLGLLDNDGLVLGSGFKRYSGKFSGSYNVTEKIKVNSNVLYSHSNLSRSPLGNDDTVFRRFQGQAPTSRDFNNNPDGTFSNDLASGQNQSFGNPLYYQDKFVRDNLEQRLSASVGVNWDIIDDLSLSITGSHFAVNNHNENFNKEYRTGSSISGSLNSTRQASVELQRTLRNQLTGTLNYTKKFGNHNFNALLGAEYFKDNYFQTRAGTRNSSSDLLGTLSEGAQADGLPVSFESEYVITSTFGRLLYDYDNKYLVGLTFRNDGSSRLGNNKFDFFPGVSFGWNAHNETFFQDSSISKYISKLKPRLSYGVNGNQDALGGTRNFRGITVPINYRVFGAYGQQGVYNGQTGYANSGLATLDLLWEKATTFNVGLDISFFNDRLTFITDVYSRDVKDKIADLTLPFYTGFSAIKTNNGTIRNKGFELQVNGDIIRNDNLTWNVGATFTSNKNYAQKLPENDNDLNRQDGVLIWNADTGKEEWVGGFQEGQRLGNDLVVAYEQAGIYATQDEADADNSITDFLMPLASRNKRWAGDVKWVDQNGDGVINSLDRKVIGRTTPDFIGGLTTSLKYKNFNLFVKTDFATGHLVWNHIRNKGYGQTQGNLNQPIEVLDSWTPTNTNTDWPRFVFVNDAKNVWRGNEGRDFRDSNSLQNSGNSRFWEKGDYLALREVTLSYNVPTKYFKDVIQRLNVYVTGSNLHYFKSMSGDTPEVGGVQYGAFPLPRTFTLGLNVTF